MRKTILIILLLLCFSITLPVSAQVEDLFMLMGSGDDVIEVSLDVFEYPLIEFYSECMDSWQTVTLTAVLEDGTYYPILDSAPCDRGGFFYIGHLDPKILELVQIETKGDWQLIFHRSATIPWYEAPVTIRGYGSAVFAVNNHGRTASFWTNSEHEFQVTQYGAQDLQVFYTVFTGSGLYNGKKMIRSGSPLFTVNISGEWELSFDDGPIVDYALLFSGESEEISAGYAWPNFLDYQSSMDVADGAHDFYFLHYLLSQFEGITGSYQIENYVKVSDPEGQIPEMLNEAVADFYQHAYPDEYFLAGYPLYGKPVMLDGHDYRMVWRTALTGRQLEITIFIVAPDDTGNTGPYDIYIVFSNNIYPKG